LTLALDIRSSRGLTPERVAVEAKRSGVPSQGNAMDLPAAEAEAIEVSGCYGVPTTLGGKKFNRGNIQKELSRCGFFHFATHGKRPDALESGIGHDQRLADGESMGFLVAEHDVVTARELLHIPFEKTRLGIFATCVSATGEMLQGSGLYGFLTIVHEGLVPTLIGAQWNVNCRETKTLMVEFHREWCTGEVGVA